MNDEPCEGGCGKRLFPDKHGLPVEVSVRDVDGAPLGGTTLHTPARCRELRALSSILGRA